MKIMPTFKLLLITSLLSFTLACNQNTSSTINTETAHSTLKKAVIISTTAGDITVELYPQKAPETVSNFLRYVEKKSYDNTIFHRTIPGFMIQGGGFNQDLEKTPTQAPVQNEADNGLPNSIGSIAMARTGAPHSASNQFFINVANNRFLNHTSKDKRGWGYTVFGQVISGMSVVNTISTVQTTQIGGHKNVPLKAVKIINIKIIKE